MIPILMGSIFFQLASALEHEDIWYGKVRLLELKNNKGILSFVDLTQSSKGSFIIQNQGDIEIQLSSSDEGLLYQNYFSFDTVFIPEPGPDCFSGEIECDLSTITVSEDTETIAIPSLPTERFIRILKDNEIKLEIDLQNPPYEYQEEFDEVAIIAASKLWMENKESRESIIQLLQ